MLKTINGSVKQPYVVSQVKYLTQESYESKFNILDIFVERHQSVYAFRQLDHE